MILTDVNVLTHAHREDAADHRRFRGWMEAVIAGPEAFGVADLVLSGFLRVATHPRIFHPPTPLVRALEFCDFLRKQPNCCFDRSSRTALGDLHRPLFAGTRRRQPRGRRLSRSAGNRVGLRVDHDRS